jgi:hypothetical protein
MKHLRILNLFAATAVALSLVSCGWESSGRDDSWSDTAINVSGTYHGTEGYGGAVVHNLPGRAVTYLSVQQNGTKVFISDNLGGQYSGKISSGSKTASGSGSSSIIQYAYNYEVKGTDYQGQHTTLVGTFEAVAEGQLLHDRVISGSWIGSSKNGGIYGVAASVTDSQLVNSGITEAPESGGTEEE